MKKQKRSIWKRTKKFDYMKIFRPITSVEISNEKKVNENE